MQSLLLLKQTLEGGDNTTALLPNGKLVNLGNYQELVHRHEVGRGFSFKVLFTLDDSDRPGPDWVKELLQTLGPEEPMGLKVSFACDEETRVVSVSSIAVFIGDEAVLVHDSSLGLDGVTITAVNYRHRFWHTWWDFMKNYLVDRLDADPYVVFYKGEASPFYNTLDPRQDLEDYSFEKAMEDLRAELLSSALSYQNFLPVNWRKPVSHKTWEYTSQEVIIEKAKALQDRYSWPTKPSQKPSPIADSPFNMEIFYSPISGSEPFEGSLNTTPITLQVCSAFRQLVKEMIYLGSLRRTPERDYTFSGTFSEGVGQFGERMPDVLFRSPELLERVNAEFDRFQLGYKLKLSQLLYEDSNPSNRFTLLLLNKGTGVSASIQDVGFGVSQVLPIIVQSLLSQKKMLLIEQPEIHLHPALQAELGDLFIQSALGEQKNTFVLETHSEHLILRILRRIRETTEGELEPGLAPIRPEDVAILYVQPGSDGSKVVEIPIRPDGKFAKRWPQGFFAERAKELF